MLPTCCSHGGVWPLPPPARTCLFGQASDFMPLRGRKPVPMHTRTTPREENSRVYLASPSCCLISGRFCSIFT